MGTENISAATPNTVIPASDHNKLRNAFIGHIVPRNSSGNAEDDAGNCGTSAFRFAIGYIKQLFIGSVADNISVEADTSDCIIKVGGTERARIPQSVGLLPAGMIVAYSGTSAPAEWLICDGSQVSRTTYARLFAAIGETYGEGNNTTTFNLPDFRGRFLRGANNPGNGSGASGNDPDAASRTAMATGGNSGDTVGSIQDDALASHLHTIATSFGDVSGAGGNALRDSGSTNTGSTGGNETRPKNAAVNFIIKT